MGNCLFGGLGDEQEFTIKVIKSDGEVLEFYSPVTAGSLSDEFSGHAIYSTMDLLLKPLPHHHYLIPDHSYYLLPYIVSDEIIKNCVGNFHARSNSESLPAAITPYRMSLDYNHRVLKRSYTDVFSRSIYARTRHKEKTTRRKRASSGKSGMWKVKLVINTEELLQILSEDGKTHELIESVRAVANGKSVVASSISSGSSETDLSVVHV